MNRINNKIALITGGARGIGAAIARLFAQEGAQVIVSDILDDEGEKLAQEIKGRYIHLDVSSESDWQTCTQLVKEAYPKIDILVNNAGITGFIETTGLQDPENCSLEAWHKIHQVNLDGVFFGCKYGIALMKEHGGSIVNISSRSGMVGIPRACAYASSKASVRNHTKSVALYCAEQGYKIRCNSLHPGAILTPMWDPMLGSDKESRDQNIKAIASGVPLGTMGEPIDVAYAALYLASDESKYVTGTELTIDGGILAGSAASPKKAD
jgi:3(or 17)beta-hydroxysteroid dehydrogenase